MEDKNFFEEKYNIVLSKEVIGQSKVEAYEKLVNKIVDACENSETSVSYIECSSMIIPILWFSDRFEMADIVTINGPYVAGKVDNIPVVCCPCAGIGEFFLCHGDGYKNIPVTNQEVSMYIIRQLEDQFTKETIAKGIIL